MAANKLHQAVRYLRQTALGAEVNGMTDGQLLHYFLAEGEEVAFEVLLRRHGRMVLGVCQRILKNACDAEDAFQATFLILMRKAGALRDRQTIGNWLYGVAQHTALKCLAAARKRRVKERQAAAMVPAEMPVEEIIWHEWRPLLDREVGRLPARYRTLIILCDLEQKSYQEAAALVGCSAGTVAGRLSRARDLLARRLTRYGVNLSVATLAALLAQNGAAATLLPPLAAATLNAATASAAGELAFAGAVSAPVAALTQGVLRAMWMTKLKQALAVLSLVAGIGMGTGTIYLALAPKAATAQARAADGQAEARAVIDRAIKAHGGAANLSKFKGVSAKREGKWKVENVFWDASVVWTYQMPDKARYDAEVQNPINGGKFSVSKFVNGTRGWQVANGNRVRELRAAEVAEIMDDMYAQWVASLVPLIEKGFEFAPAGQITVDKKEATGVRVSRKGHPDVNLYFDKDTGLLIKSERRAKDEGTGQEFTAESFYFDYKPFEGALWATRRLDKRDGMELETGAGKFELSSYKAHDKLDEALFAKP